MARQRDFDPELLEFASEGPIVLVGQPGALRGDVTLRNSSPERVRLRKLPLAVEAEQASRLMAARPGAGPQVRLSPGILRPGHTGPVSLSLSLDPYTPPGEYQAEIDVAGRMLPVTMHVTENVDLRISPAQLVLENRPNELIAKRIVARNLGNVPLSIGKIGAVFLDDDLLVCRTLRHAAAAVGDDLRPVEEYLSRILLSAKQVAESSGILRVHNRSGELTLQPGEVQPIDLDIRIPPTLDRRGRYRGVIALSTASLTFLIVPTSGPAIPEEASPASRAEEPAPKRRGRRGVTNKQDEEENQS
jgi:hypothetical protein